MKLPALKEIIEERKGKAIEDLSDSYAKNRMPLEEYERLVEYIHKIESERELVVVERIVAEHGSGSEPPEESSYDDDEIDSHANYEGGQNNNLVLLSSRTFSGPIKSGAQYVSLLGNGNIKIRRADLEKRKTVLNVVSILGENVIYVESGIKVSLNAVPILGNCSINQKVNEQTRSGEPELVISGAALLGDITVKLLK